MAKEPIRWVTKSEQIEKRFRERIRRGELKAGQKLDAETAIAKQLGVHRLTVNKAMANLVREGLLRRIQGRGTFVLEAKERTPTGCLGVLLSSPSERVGADSFYGDILGGIRAEHNGDVLLLGHDPVRRGLPGPPIKSVAWDRFDGLIMLEVFDEEYIARAKQASPVPLVLVDFEPQKPLCDYVIQDNYEAGRRAVEHLWTLGHRRIAHVGEPPPPLKSFVDPAWQDRRRGWEEALGAKGVRGLEALFFPLESRSSAGIEKILEQARARPAAERPTAWFCATDELAIRMMRLAQDEGLALPGELSFIGFGGTASGALVRPALTSLQADVAEMGRWAVRRLKERRENREAPLQRQVLPVRLVKRDSCAPPDPTRQLSPSPQKQAT